MNNSMRQTHCMQNQKTNHTGSKVGNSLHPNRKSIFHHKPSEVSSPNSLSKKMSTLANSNKLKLSMQNHQKEKNSQSRNEELISRLSILKKKNLLRPEKSFNLETALQLSKLCSVSYEEPSVIQNGILNEGFKNFHYIGLNDPWPKAIIAANDQYISVCFRGTKSSWDWLSNLEIMQVQVPIVPNGKGKVHKGIHRATMRRYDEIMTVLKGMQKQKLRPIYLTGHSLGGGMAIIAAARMNHENIAPDAVYTFGSPKIGDPQFALEYALHPKLHQNTFRIVNYCDVVPKIPHTGNFVHVSEDQERLFAPDGKMMVGFSYELSNQDTLNALQEYGITCTTNFEIVNSHWIEAYIKNIESSLQEMKKKGPSLLEKLRDSAKKNKGLERDI